MIKSLVCGACRAWQRRALRRARLPARLPPLHRPLPFPPEQHVDGVQEQRLGCDVAVGGKPAEPPVILGQQVERRGDRPLLQIGPSPALRRGCGSHRDRQRSVAWPRRHGDLFLGGYDEGVGLWGCAGVAEMTDSEWQRMRTGVDTHRLLAKAGT
jgi:hypothetical protein